MAHVTSLTYQVWALLTAGWTNLTADVVTGSVSGMDGMTTNKPTDRLAATGQFSFMLKNSTGKYSPGHASALAGWKTNIYVLVRFTYDGKDYDVMGRIASAPDGIQIDSANKGMPFVRVTVLDWMDGANRDPISNPGILANKRGDEVITAIIAMMPTWAIATDLDVGINVFPAVFDTVTSKTKVYDELAKVVYSEMGYSYLKHDPVRGEILIFENAHTRNGLSVETSFSLPTDASGRELREDGGYELREDGGYQMRDEFAVFDGDNTFLSRSDSISHGANLLNRLSIYANPRKVDTSPVVLFRLSEPLVIGAGQTYELKGTYADPNGGLPVNGQNMIDPDSGIPDYAMNTIVDGSGTDITANLIITTNYGTEGFTHQLTNNSILVGYVTLFNCRGYGIYIYNQIEHIASNAPSIAANGTFNDSINQKYQKSLDFGKISVDAICYMEKDPDTRFDRVYFIANSSAQMMQAFLLLGAGDMIRLKSTQANIDAYYFIQGRDWQILKGNIIMFSWIVKEFLNLVLGLSLISSEFNLASPQQDLIDWGYLPYITSLSQRSESSWICITGWSVSASQSIIRIDGGFGIVVTITGQKSIRYFRQNTAGTTYGSWRTDDNTVSDGRWMNIVTTWDETSLVPPKIYINGVDMPLNEEVAINGTLRSLDGMHLTIGNPYDYVTPLFGKIKDVRIYNRILSASEIAAMYAEGAGGFGVTDGMVFQGPVVRTKDLGYFTNRTLLSTDRLLDNMYGYVGIPHGSPITRLP